MKSWFVFAVVFVLSVSMAMAQTTLLSEGFEDTDATGALPNSSSLVTAPGSFQCTNGTWQLFKAYRVTSSPTSGSWDLRILKSNHSAVSGIAYIITPPLPSIGSVAFDYKRGRPHEVLYSTNGGTDWVMAFTAPNYNTAGTAGYINSAVNVMGPDVLLKIQDNTVGDDDIDNLLVTAASGDEVERIPSQVPTELSLKNYPNPFNPTTKIIFSVKTSGKATVKVYDMRGREIATVFEGAAKAGEIYQVPFGFVLASSGIYYARLESVDGVRTQKMVFMK